MVDAVVNNRHMVLPCASYLEGQYGHDGLYVGVPTRLGSDGVEGIVEIGLTPEEQAMFDHSAGAVQGLVGKLVEMGALRDPAED
jgi:malate dehydrogenase